MDVGADIEYIPQDFPQVFRRIKRKYILIF